MRISTKLFGPQNSPRPFPFETYLLPLILTSKKPAVGLEPTTPALRMLCSAVELRWHEIGHIPPANLLFAIFFPD